MGLGKHPAYLSDLGSSFSPGSSPLEGSLCWCPQAGLTLLPWGDLQAVVQSCTLRTMAVPSWVFPLLAEQPQLLSQNMLPDASLPQPLNPILSAWP